MEILSIRGRNYAPQTLTIKILSRLVTLLQEDCRTKLSSFVYNIKTGAHCLGMTWPRKWYPTTLWPILVFILLGNGAGEIKDGRKAGVVRTYFMYYYFDFACRYFAITLWHFIQLMLMYYGGEKKMIEDFGQSPVSITVPPICCLFFCLPKFTMSK